MKKIFLGFLLVLKISFAVEDNHDFYKFKILREDNTHLTFERYESTLGFYDSRNELNLYSHFIDIKQYKDSTLLYWNLGQGYLYLRNDWDLEYNIEKNFVFFQKADLGEKDYNGWDVDILFRNHLNKVNWLSNTWNRSWGIGLSFTDGGNLSFDNFDETYTDLFLTYRLTTSLPNLGMGGTFLSLSGNLGGVYSTVPDNGYRANLIAFSSTNLGYGFSTEFYLKEEVRNYGNYSNSFIIEFSNKTSWTYELGHNFAFSTDIYFQSENFFGGTSNADRLEFYIYPHINYDKKINESFKIFAEIGFTPLSLVKSSDGFDNSGSYLRGILGFAYRW